MSIQSLPAQAPPTPLAVPRASQVQECLSEDIIHLSEWRSSKVRAPRGIKGASGGTVQAANGYDDLPITGAWTPDDPPGNRQFAQLGGMKLEGGGQLPQTRLAYETWGTLNAERSNAVLVLHALTGDSHVCGEAGPGHVTPGWWNDIVGPGKAIDTDTFFVVAPNVLGGCQGSTGPASLAPDGRAWGSRFPRLTTRDQVACEARLSDYLGIDRWDLIIGGSLGGQRALEWGVMYPDRVRQLIVVASGAATTAEQAAWCHAQLHVLELDPYFRGGDYYEAAPGEGPGRGLSLAREIAHTTYRSPNELDERFGAQAQNDFHSPLQGGSLAVQSYLEYHGAKLAKRFDAGSYRTLTRSMLTHDVGRGRGGIEAALGTVTARTLVIGVDSDRLFFPSQSWQIEKNIPDARCYIIHSPHGHDGFLIESAAVSGQIKDFLEDGRLPVRLPPRRPTFSENVHYFE
ncbi:MAG: homoserine O-acetyltransferase [Actinomycetaceae bacterium]|nr:homoserine O-acetyltransferase [Actinomycetaceae bacterium]